MSSPVRSGSQKANDTLAFLRSKILSGEWPIDELIPKEPELMDIIGVGKSTVREAVRSLATLGMLQTVPGVGTFVRARTPASSILTQFLADQDLEEVLVYRRSLEIEAAQTAAVRRSEEQLEAIRESYRLSVEAHEQHAEPVACNQVSHEHSLHRLIVEASGSKLLLDLYNGVMATLNEAMGRGQVFVGATEETVLLDHGALLRALEQRNVRDAAHAMALHADRDLGLHTDELDLFRSTERAETLIEAGFDPRSSQD